MTANRVSTYTTGSGEGESRNGEQKKEIWLSLLDSVSSGKRLPEKNLIVLGGTPESQRDFLESLSSSESKRNFDRQKVPPVANSFALGYSYYDVLDADQDDTLARVSLYLVSQPSREFASLVAPLLTPEAIPNTALVVLLDWSQPHLWLRQIWTWIQVFQKVVEQLSPDSRDQMGEVMAAWKERGRGGAATNLDGTPSATASGDGDSSLPLGPGEWEEPLGLPLCVVCQNAQKMEFLEKSQSWKEVDFDTVLQYLRTILLRHGASLVYTSQNSPSQLPSLIHSTLGITSLLKRQPLKHNVIDRDKIVVPPNWDSWGKIRVLGGSFDAELVSNSWSEDFGNPDSIPWESEQTETAKKSTDQEEDNSRKETSAIAQYEDWCRDPTSGGLAVVENAMHGEHWVSVESDDTQDFLERQLRILEAFKAKAPDTTQNSITRATQMMNFDNEKSVSEHIGPVQFNMGGIQVDADDMLQRLKDRNTFTSTPETEAEESDNAANNMVKDYDNEQLHDFFSGLMNRKGA